MSAIAQALAKAGIVEEEKANNIEKEREFFKEKYSTISLSIRQILSEKRRLLKLQEIVKNSTTSEPDDYVFNNIRELFGMPPMNLTSAPNQMLILDRIKKSLDDLEHLLIPMLKASRKLEKEWGFKRNGPNRSKQQRQ